MHKQLLVKLFYVLTLSLVFSFSASAQAFSVKGKVTDASGIPLEGATITEKGKNNSTVSNAQGFYEMSVSSGKAVLVISVVGHEIQEIPVDNKAEIIALLKPTADVLGDVVVVGYGTKKKGDVTGAISSISGEKLRAIPTANLTSSIPGRVPGVEVSASSFRPGSGARIRIRGNRSLSGGNDPLFIVDGFPVSYTIDDLNPTDIE